MAKPTKKSETAKIERKSTVAYSAAQKAGKEILKLHPSLKEVYVSSDGTAFYNSNDAHNHSRSLADKSVTKVQRKETVEEYAKEEPIQPSAKAATATEDTNETLNTEE